MKNPSVALKYRVFLLLLPAAGACPPVRPRAAMELVKRRLKRAMELYGAQED